MRPSASAASVAVCSWSRPWIIEIMASERVSIHLTGRPHSFEACASAYSSACTLIFEPKPPPTSGAITRTLDSGTPQIAATKVRTKCGTCVEV